MDYSQIIDISLPLHEGTIVYPGNPKIEIEEQRSEASKSVISKITLGTHTGTHVDAPKHCLKDGAGLDEVPLSNFIGQCKVIDATVDAESISLQTVQNHQITKGDRILFKTQNSLRGYEEFYNDFIYLSPEAAQHLADQEVALVAIDYFSIKQKGSTDNRPHTLLLEKNISIVEGVDLSKVEPGEYFLVVLPLHFVGRDGSPARAVLLK